MKRIMDDKKLSRGQKEKTYIDLMGKWGQPAHFIDYCKQHLGGTTDEQLDKDIKIINREIKNEEEFVAIKKFFLYLILILVTLGIVGFLVFGVRQLF